MTLDEAVALTRPIPADLTIPDLLDAAAWAHGTAPALRTPAGIAMTHRHLAEATRVRAAQLASTGVGPGVPVAVLVDHEPASVQAIIAIVRAGGCCVPLDPHWPVDRCVELLTALQVRHLVIGTRFWQQGTAIRLRMPNVNTVMATPASRHPRSRQGRSSLPLERPHSLHANHLRSWDTLPRSAVVAPSPSDLAYAVGATEGIRHQNLVDLLNWLNLRNEVTHRDSLLQAAPLSLDLSMHDIFGVLAAGGSILLLPDSDLAEPRQVAEALVTRAVTLWTSTPTAFTAVLAALATQSGGDRGWLRRVSLSGEAVPLDAVEALRREFPNAELVALGNAA
ncbi:hypothetical protein GCM10009839_75020 [Catenulispora yoronensis]|uniref:AMP-dependent synthetase/ligase domain-containing protein n=1 Tax=Catenulispora yoronensis TaxID=450799 RepID=A0ABN2VEC3_9ACTN